MPDYIQIRQYDKHYHTLITLHTLGLVKGRPQLKWLSMMKTELKNYNLTWNTAFEFVENEKEWNEFIKPKDEHL